MLEINAAVWLGERSWADPAAPDLADIPDGQVAQWARLGIDAIWFLGVWKKGKATRRICLSNADLRAVFERALPGCAPDDIIGSPFSIADYSLDPALGKEDSLARLREKLNAQGLALILDFVPNHMAIDHPWVAAHPDRFVRGSEAELAGAPSNYFRPADHPDRILAHGRDPYFAGWTDTAQIDFFSHDARRALQAELLRVADVCDGVRCDMAMLVTNEVFRNTWGDFSPLEYPDGEAPEFWPEAIDAVKARRSDFLFLAEVYWGLERRLQSFGFDYTYDKALYDRALGGDAAAALGAMGDAAECQERQARFLENHDEARAAEAFGSRQRAVATFLASLPGLHLYHEGQFEGRRVRLPIQLARRPAEPADADTARFYERLLDLTNDEVMREGEFGLPPVRPAWEGNHSYRAIAAAWRADRSAKEYRLIVANLGEHQAQAYTDLPLDGFSCEALELSDLLSDTRYVRPCDELARKGLYLDLGPGQRHLFRVRPASA